MGCMKVALAGYGVEGKSALKYWQAKRADITICDARADLDPPPGVSTQLGPEYLDNLDRFDIIMRTPGLHPQRILERNPGVKTKITTIINEFLAVAPTKNIIGVTGTKGKGTTTTLIAKMLEATGKTVFVGGNIGLPPFEFLSHLTPDSWVVLELSSFQLYDLNRSPHLAVCLMMAPEHLNWHSDMDDYVRAKAQLFAHQTASDIAVYFADNTISKQIAGRSPGTKIPYFAPPGAHVKNGAIVIDGHAICQTSELKLLGAHNWQNACAAATAVWQVAPDAKAIRQALTSFTGLEHRLEFVREVGQVKYYDDSFGTTPETAVVAIEAFKEPKVIILGGSTKESDYTGLARAVKAANARRVILIGNTTNPKFQTAAPAIEAALTAGGFGAVTSLVRPGGAPMTEIVAAAREAAQPGDVVLLSAACASFDMFANYKERGDQFKTAVQAL
jgi:UDP-N-acetylmuramoylalanine--D-glutamate ligase